MVINPHFQARGGYKIVALFLALFSLSLGGQHASAQREFSSASLSQLNPVEVSFTSGALQMAGMLFEPDVSSQVGIVIIHGSGTSRRDNGWYLTLVEHLREQGNYVLLPDKRGSERSEGDWRSSSLQELAQDSVAAVDFLKTRYDLTHVGVVGMSQGGKIAPVVATQSAEVNFVVNMVGGILTMHRSLVFEERNNIAEMGIPRFLAAIIAPVSSWTLRAFRQRDFWSAVGNFDPLPYWAEVKVPTLMLFGREDTNTPTEKSVRRVSEIENPHIEVRVFEGSGHLLEDPPGRGTAIIRREALTAISDFIARNSY